ncbi:hypothetical protein F5884DRAFT_838162 [Xylogone sp. PMI_703]|nr:hypothetical protein F5884DRAFT_838162 [Xylogone sp. PMI_703]
MYYNTCQSMPLKLHTSNQVFVVGVSKTCRILPNRRWRDPEYGEDDTFNSEYVFDSDDDNDDDDNDNLADEEMGRDSDYSNEGSGMMAEDANDCSTAEVDCAERPMPPNGDTAKLDEYGEAIRQWKALCYEDICLWIVKNPKKGERDILAMEHNLFVPGEHSPNPLSDLPPSNTCDPRRYNPCRQLYRRRALLLDELARSEDEDNEGALEGRVAQAASLLQTKPMTYQTYAFYINRLGRNTGFEDKLTSYCFRRGRANALDDAVRDQVMRHDPFTGIFNGSYINHSVRFNVQDAFLESEITNDGLTRAFTHMSIRCNPSAPEGVPRESIERIFATDPDIVNLERQFKARMDREHLSLVRDDIPDILDYDEHERLFKRSRELWPSRGQQLRLEMLRELVF